MKPFEILVIEDHTRHQKIFAETIVDELGATIRFATTGEEALEIIAQDKKPDLVILDLDLPKISGKEVLKKMKADLRTKLIPVIVLTGSSSQLAEMDLLDNGAEDYLEKGSHPDILVSRIRAQVRHKKAIDRLQNLAIDRDIFAASVLANISAARKQLNSQAEEIKQKLTDDPVQTIPDVLTIMDQMCEHASKLGQFANDVIQSVRDTQRQAVPRVINMMDFVDQANALNPEGPGPRVRLTAKTNLEPVVADSDYFRILMMNLLQNILNRSGRAEGFVDAEISQHASIGATVKLMLRDFGSAVPTNELPTYFDPQISTAESTNEQVFDISMAVVSNVVQKLNGSIWAGAPIDDKGGVLFHLILPGIEKQN